MPGTGTSTLELTEPCRPPKQDPAESPPTPIQLGRAPLSMHQPRPPHPGLPQADQGPALPPQEPQPDSQKSGGKGPKGKGWGWGPTGAELPSPLPGGHSQVPGTSTRSNPKPLLGPHSHPLICVSPSAKFSGNIRLGGCSREWSWEQRAGRREAGRPRCRLREACGWSRLVAGVCSGSALPHILLSNGGGGGGGREGGREGRGGEGGRAGGRRLAQRLARRRAGKQLRTARPWWPRASTTRSRGAASPDTVPPPRSCGRARCPSPMGASGGNLSVVCSCPVPGVTRVHSVRGSSRHKCTLNRRSARGAGREPPVPGHPCWAESKEPSLTGQQCPEQPRCVPGLDLPAA